MDTGAGLAGKRFNERAVLLELLRTLPWCKQGDKVLIAVHKCTPEVLQVIKDHEVKVFPGGISVKLNHSTLAMFQSKFDEGTPVPILFVWKPDCLEISFRTHKSMDFPYDAWTDPAAAAYERECVMVSAADLGGQCVQYHQELIANSKPCPAIIQL